MSRIKLAVSLSAGIAGIVLMVLSLRHGVHLLPMFLAFAAFAVTAYWGGNYIALTKQLIGKRVAELERHLHAGEETPASRRRERRNSRRRPQRRNKTRRHGKPDEPLKLISYAGPASAGASRLRRWGVTTCHTSWFP